MSQQILSMLSVIDWSALCLFALAAPINVYTGLMRSGKSYEVVSEVIVPAVRSGRRVVTNVDGISEDKIHEYLKKKYPDDDSNKYGKIVHVSNAQVFLENFFPYYDDQKDAHTDTIVQPGDLVCIDEAWRFWGSGMKLHKNHQSFFLEHGHFTHETTRIACDLALMIQDMGTLHRFLKNVVAFSFRTHKKVALGLANTYSLNMWEGNKMVKANLIGSWTRKYRKEIFPLYSSFKGGAEGVIVNADRRQNIFTNKKLWFMLVLLIGGGATFFYNTWKYFHPPELGKDGKPIKTASDASAVQGGQNMPVAPYRPPTPSFSESWKISGSFYAQGKQWVVLTNGVGAVRIDSPSMFQNSGYAQIGEVDGTRVTVWSGAPMPKTGLLSSAPAPAPIIHPAVGEVKK